MINIGPMQPVSILSKDRTDKHTLYIKITLVLALNPKLNYSHLTTIVKDTSSAWLETVPGMVWSVLHVYSPAWEV